MPNESISPLEFPAESNCVAVPSVTKSAENVDPFAFPRPTDDVVKNATIMIVDDEETVTRTVRKHLRSAGFECFDTLEESDRVDERIRQVQPDIILLDIQMRPVCGLRILEFVRENESTRNTPVIILTSSTDEETKIKALGLGADDFLTKPVVASELVARVRNTLSAKLDRDRLTNYSAQLESDVLSDALTGVANRRAFEYELKRRVIEWDRKRTPLSLLMVDVDLFKTFNDRHGHHVGDMILREVAQTLRNSMREMDLVARYGGEEFAIILPATNSDESKLASERARIAIDGHHFEVQDQHLHLSVSVGVANAMNGDTAELLIRRADAALYTSKQNGRNCSYRHDGRNCLPISGFSRNHEPNFQHGDTSVDSLIEKARIAIVDDEPVTIAIVQKYLRSGGHQKFIPIGDATKALGIIRREAPDIVLLDIRMPEVNGLDILSELRNDERTKHMPVLVLTSATDTATKIKALNLGANDFLEKPVYSAELIARVRNTILAKSHVDFLAQYSNQLEHQVSLRTSELYSSRREAIQCLARAAEIRDDQTGHHVLRVGRYAAIIAQELGFSEERTTWLEHAAQLHDVGKIGIPDSILKKPEGLTCDEFEIMKEHCAVGSRIIRDVNPAQSESIKSHTALGASIFDNCNSPVMRMAAVVAETHHEKWDGSGYPHGLAGEQIPIEGRITAVADVFDALTTSRPYKAAIPLEESFAIIQAGRGSHFDPTVQDAFFERKQDIIRIFADYGDG